MRRITKVFNLFVVVVVQIVRRVSTVRCEAENLYEKSRRTQIRSIKTMS